MSVQGGGKKAGGQAVDDRVARGRGAGGQGVGQARALWVTEVGRAELLSEPLPSPGAGEALVRALYSAVSRGTERLVLEGRVGAELHSRMRCPHQAGEFSFPIKYGYCCVGRVVEGPPSLAGRTAFCLHPHQDRFVVPAEALALVPEGVEPARAVLTANLETALNAVWDSGLSAGYRVAVVGAGTVGLLVAWLVSQMPGAVVEVIDLDPSRARLCEALGLVLRDADEAQRGCDVVFHCSGSSGGLTTALELAGVEARVMELSWYGDASVSAPLGGRFHSDRLQIIASQVGRVAAPQRARWDHGRRLRLALSLLRDARLDALLQPPVPFEELPRRWPELVSGGGPATTPLIHYP